MKKIYKNIRVCAAVLFALTFAAFSATALYGQTIDTLWYEDWEGNWSNDWHVSNGTWEVGEPTNVGPETTHQGLQCAATRLDGNYDDNQDSRLIRHTIFTVPTGPNPRLRFWHWFKFNAGDYGQVQIKAVEDSVWRTLEGGNYGYNAGGGYYSCDRWTRPFLDLSEYAGQTVQIAFRFRSVDVSYPYGWETNPGWYIDEVLVGTGELFFNNPENWEGGFGDWYADYGEWEVGEPDSEVGPGSAYEGQCCVGTILDGNYWDNGISRLISPPHTIPDAAHNPRLRFYTWYSFNAGDYGRAQTKIVGDSIWHTLDGGEYSNTSGGIWYYEYLPLTEYSNQTIQISFYFRSVDVSYPYGWEVSSGWYIDSLCIQADNVGTIAGFVECNGLLMEDVYVRLIDTGINAITDSSGNYSLSLIEPGTYDVLFSHPDFGDILETDIEVFANDTTYLNIECTGINSEVEILPSKFSLSQNYPNPFNPTTTIGYSLPTQSHVNIEIYDILGRRIETLVSDKQPAGNHQVTWNADKCPSGIYFYRLQTGDFSETKKMMLLK